MRDDVARLFAGRGATAPSANTLRPDIAKLFAGKPRYQGDADMPGRLSDMVPKAAAPGDANQPGQMADQIVGIRHNDTFDSPIEPEREAAFQAWKAKYAPKDSGVDYDLRGAFLAGLTPDPKTGHWADYFKKPNHPTFSVESIYARERPDLAGRWEGETFIPPKMGPEPKSPMPARTIDWRTGRPGDPGPDMVGNVGEIGKQAGKLGTDIAQGAATAYEVGPAQTAKAVGAGIARGAITTTTTGLSALDAVRGAVQGLADKATGVENPDTN